MTVQYRDSIGRAVVVRKNTPQVIGPYQFLDQFGVKIALGSYVSCQVELRTSGQGVITMAAMISDPTNGFVSLPGTYTFTTTAIWQAQFVCVDALGGKLYGEPLQFRVVNNEDDAALTDDPLPY